MNEIDHLVTIVVPCFNNGSSIKETIQSVLNQTYPNWELICVDDGSTDNTREIIEKYTVTDSRIKLLIRDSEPKGGSHCRNIGALAARGEFLIFLDGDDLLSNICIEHRLNEIVNTDFNFVSFSMATFTDGIENCRKLSRGDVVDFDYYFMTGSAVWQVTSPLYRTQFVRDLGGFDERFMRFQDIEFGLRATAISNGNFKSFCDREPDCFYRHPKGKEVLSSSKLLRGLESYGFLLSIIKDLKGKGYLKNRYKYSLGLLSTYANIFFVMDILRSRGENVSSFEKYNSVDLRSEMMPHHKWLFRILCLFKNPISLHLRLSHLYTQFCRIHFLKII